MEAWFSTAFEIEEVLSGTGGDQLHVMVADVIKSFDTVDRSILDCALGRLGLPDWFRRAYFSFHSQVRLRIKLAAGLGEPRCRDGGIPQGCPLCMVFIVALYFPWCRHLEVMPDVKPQLYANNLKCSAERPGALFLTTVAGTTVKPHSRGKLRRNRLESGKSCSPAERQTEKKTREEPPPFPWRSLPQIRSQSERETREQRPLETRSARVFHP